MLVLLVNKERRSIVSKSAIQSVGRGLRNVKCGYNYWNYEMHRSLQKCSGL